MLQALIRGTTDPIVLADLAKRRLRTKIPALRQALAGRFRPHHAFMVSQILAHVDYLDEVIASVSERVDRDRTYVEDLTRLDTIPGVNRRTAEVLIAELGVDMNVFPSERHLASWVALCPGQNESAGKQKSGKTRQGNRWLRAALTEAALSASRPNTAFAARYRRLKRHRGHKKAVIAVAHNIAVTVFYLLSRQSTYREAVARLRSARRRPRQTSSHPGAGATRVSRHN